MSRAPRTLALALLLLNGCVLPLGGLGPQAEPDAAVMDGGRRADGGVERDAGPVIPADAGPQRDGDTCPPGFVDVDMNPANGCECELSIDLVERCNGRDDDCDPSTVDGQDETVFGMVCDGMDSDFCRDGTWVCNAGTLACSDPMVDSVERCDVPGDEDCDTLVDEGGAVDAAVFYADNDMDGYGDPGSTVTACAAPAGYVADDTDCDDSTPSINPGMSESCNGRDDDCSTLPDDNGACAPCDVVYLGAAPYMICTTNPLSWGGRGGLLRELRLPAGDHERRHRERDGGGAGRWRGLPRVLDRPAPERLQLGLDRRVAAERLGRLGQRGAQRRRLLRAERGLRRAALLERRVERPEVQRRAHLHLRAALRRAATACGGPSCHLGCRTFSGGPMRRLIIALAALFLLACGPGEIGDECVGGSAMNDCVDGAFCTQMPAEDFVPPDNPNNLKYFCRAICDSNAQCEEGFVCLRAEGSMVSTCQPDPTMMMMMEPME